MQSCHRGVNPSRFRLGIVEARPDRATNSAQMFFPFQGWMAVCIHQRGVRHVDQWDSEAPRSLSDNLAKSPHAVPRFLRRTRNGDEFWFAAFNRTEHQFAHAANGFVW